MRQWQQAVARAGDALVAVRACELAGVDLDVAVTGRAALLEHVATVLDDVARRPRMRDVARGQQVPIAILETDPIDALARVLRGRSRLMTERAPSELLDAGRPVDPATAAWAEVGRQALIAGQYWDRTGKVPLSGEQSWHTVAEAAALAAAVSVLDRDLARLAGDRADVVTVLNSTVGLSVAAREVAALATPAAGPTLIVGGPTTARSSMRDIGAIGEVLAERARRDSTIDRDVRRLTILLDRAEELMPRHLLAGAEIARDLSVLAARDATGSSGASLRDELADMAQALHATCRTKPSEFSIKPVRSRPLELQLRDLRASARLALASRQELGADVATRVARRLPELVDTLARQAHTQVSCGRWAIPDRREGAVLPYAYASATNPAHTPAMSAPLAEASAAAASLRASVTTPLPPSPLAATLTRLPGHRDPRRASHPSVTVTPLAGPRMIPPRL